MRLLILVCVFLSLLGCSSKPVFVEYNAPSNSANDWFSIPADAPSQVEISSPSVPRVTVKVDESRASSESQPLSIVQLTDSLGNVSLEINRQPGAAWELVESALDQLDIALFDKDREAYRFELAVEKRPKGLFSWLKPSDDLFLVLVPQGGQTVVMIEGKDDDVPDSDRVEGLISQLLEYFEVNT
jgi:uncharacterized lipoprotein